MSDPLDLSQQYGLAAFNRPQRLVIAYSYDLPWKHEGFSAKVLGGWTVSGVTTIQDGEPFSIRDTNGGGIYYGFAGPSPSIPFGGVSSLAEIASPTACSTKGCGSTIPLATTGSPLSRVNGYINAAAFTSVPCIGGTVQGNCAGSGGASGWGDSRIGAIMGPGQQNWDLSLNKTTKVTEGTSVQFRAEFYNIWNHPQFNPPDNNFANVATTFGKISSSSVPPRVVQFALKFLF